MNWNEYSKLALRTESIPLNTYGKIAVPNDNFDMAEEREMATATYTKATRLLHAAMGLVTETAELLTYTDKVNLIEEIGDCYWYLAILADVYPIPASIDRLDDGEDPIKVMFIVSSELIDEIGKRHIFYGKLLNNDLVTKLTTEYFYHLTRFCAANKVNIEDAWEANIKKLEKRYPDLRFDNEHAIKRNVSNELSHIEEAVDMSKKDAAYIETAISLEDCIKANWEILKGGVPTKLQYDEPADDVAIEVLRILGCREEFARECLGEEFERCRFSIVHDGDKQTITAIPLKFNVAPVTMTPPLYPDTFEDVKQVELHREGFNSLLRNELTPNQIERFAMGLAFELAQKFKKDGMDALATAMGDVYRTYSGRGDKLSDFSVVGMYALLGYPMNVEGILTVTHSILKEPRNASNNSSAG